MAPSSARRVPRLTVPPWAADFLLKEGARLSRGMRDPRFLLEVQAAAEGAQAGLERALKKGLDDPEAITRGLQTLRALRAAAEVLVQGLEPPAGAVGRRAGTLRRIPVEATPLSSRPATRRSRRPRKGRPRRSRHATR